METLIAIKPGLSHVSVILTFQLRLLWTPQQCGTCSGVISGRRRLSQMKSANLPSADVCSAIGWRSEKGHIRKWVRRAPRDLICGCDRRSLSESQGAFILVRRDRANTSVLKPTLPVICSWPNELGKIRLVTTAQRPEIKGCRKRSHALIKCFQAKGRLQGTIWLGAVVLTATFHFRPAHTDALSNARAILVAGIR